VVTTVDLIGGTAMGSKKSVIGDLIQALTFARVNQETHQTSVRLQQGKIVLRIHSCSRR